ncbi:helix-turn-helix domain-containing protein [Treponema bryantii]|uniref:helix-turn-helix domain-containing protein n=1 Tax=Treponema bryantii TaxID=163 RepID=UPI0003B3B26B|nr:helix-turn-helix transcriptional regulator [Treponema bryantii]
MEEIEVRKVFAENLKKLRKQKGLSQLKLSNELQMAFTFINDIENCKKWVSPETIARFATFFDVPISTFFQLDLEEKNSKNEKIDFFVKTIAEEISKTIEDVGERFKS